jgi:hypothetical protein
MTEEQLIQKGFNAGYQLQQLKPKLVTQLQQSFTDQEHPYAKGFTAGSEQFVKDQSQQKASFQDRYFNKIKEQTKGKSPERSKDKGMDL